MTKYLNNTKIDWCDKTWNTVTGCENWRKECRINGKSYCYAKSFYCRFYENFKPTYHPERLEAIFKLKPPTKEQNRKRKSWIAKAFPHTWLVFCSSVSDLFADWTQHKWRHTTLLRIEDAERCGYPVIVQLLTKQPQNIKKYYSDVWDPSLKNLWIGVTVTSQDDVWKLKYLKDVKCTVRFASFEPLLSEIHIPPEYVSYLDWVIIGRLTGSNKVKLQFEWVQEIIDSAKQYRIPVFIKNNVEWPIEMREFPKLD